VPQRLREYIFLSLERALDGRVMKVKDAIEKLDSRTSNPRDPFLVPQSGDALSRSQKIVDAPPPPSSPTIIPSQTSSTSPRWPGDSKEAQVLTIFPWETSADLAVPATAHLPSMTATDIRVLVEARTEASSVVAAL